MTKLVADPLGAQRVVCAEWRSSRPGDEPGWTLRLDVDEPVAFCPDCDEREFGHH